MRSIPYHAERIEAGGPPPPMQAVKTATSTSSGPSCNIQREVPKEWVIDPVRACVQRRPSTRALRREWSTGTGSLAGGEINNMQTTHRKFPIKKKKKFSKPLC